MNKKILFLSISFFCLSSVYALELPKTTQTIGKQMLNIWLWELNDTVNDRDDIENNILSTIKSANYGNNITVSLHWLDANFKNYQHFDAVIDKIDNPNVQLAGFSKYLDENYKMKEGDYHLLMTESVWTSNNWYSRTAGMAYLGGNQGITSDNNEDTAAHEVGHMLGAVHNSSHYWFQVPIMYPGDLFWIDSKFWSESNKNAVRKTLGSLLNFPHAKHAFPNIAYSDSTSNATEYNGLFGAGLKGKAIVYRLPTAENFQYTIEIEQADFDTYLYIYDKNGNLIAVNDDGGHDLKSKLSNQHFSSFEEVYIVVGGFYDQGNFTLKVNKTPVASTALSPNKTYIIKTLGNTCGFEWDGTIRNGERNAKFDCAGRSDPVFFERYQNGKYFIKAKVGGATCGLEWDSVIRNGERNAKFDCSGSADPMIVTKNSAGFYYIKTKVHGATCGLEWDSIVRNGERNAKFDCSGRADPMSIIELK